MMRFTCATRGRLRVLGEPPRRPRMRARFAGHVAPATIALTIACSPFGPEPEFGELVERGEHIELWASEGIEICAGNVEYMDRFVDAFRELVGPRPEAEDLHRFYVLDDDDWDAADVCRDADAGCVRNRRTVYTRLGVPHTHELVHAEIYNGGHRFLEEGIAELFAEPNKRALPDTDVRDGLGFHGDAYLPRADYQRAAHFARFVFDRHGPAGFLEFRDATSRHSDFDDVASAFEDVTGVALDDELSAYDETFTSLCIQPVYRIPLLECSFPVTPWTDASTLRVTIDLACPSSGVLGPYGGEVFTYGAFEIADAGEYDLELTGSEAGAPHLWLFQCDGRCATRPDTQEILWASYELPVGASQRQILAAGKYWFRMARDEGTSGPVTLTVERRSR